VDEFFGDILPALALRVEAAQEAGEEDHAQHDEHDDQLHQDQNPQRAPPGHLPEAVDVEACDTHQGVAGAVVLDFHLFLFVPNTISITVPQGYNVLHITKKSENLKIHYVKKEIFESGKIETLSKMGAKIYIYDKERTICDIIKNKEKIDVDVFSKALKLFFKNKDIKVRKLIKYSKELKIEKKVREYLEVLI